MIFNKYDQVINTNEKFIFMDNIYFLFHFHYNLSKTKMTDVSDVISGTEKQVCVKLDLCEKFQPLLSFNALETP